MTITNDIKYVGVNDHQVDLFEGQYVVPNGMAYNSQIIRDETAEQVAGLHRCLFVSLFTVSDSLCRQDPSQRSCFPAWGSSCQNRLLWRG